MREDYYKFGYDILGPFLHGFVSWLRDLVKQEGIGKIFFLSRDGFMMTKAYMIMREEGDPSCRYVYFSRNSIRRSLLWRCNTYEESLKYFSNCRYTSLSEIAIYYGLSKEQVSLVYPTVVEKWTEPIEYCGIKSNEDVRNIYESFESFIRDNSKRQSELLRNYLAQEGICGRCAIVDIGWHGSMQHYLEEFARCSGLDLECHGYYVGHTPAVKLEGTARGWLYECTDSGMRKKVLCFFGVIEKLFQIQEGSTSSYEMRGDKVCPIFEEYELDGDNESARLLESVQKGTLEYVSENRNEAGENCAWKRMVEFGTSPTLYQTKLFSFLCNNDGSKNYFLPQKRLFSYGPGEFIHELSNSAWKTGFMKMAFRLPLPYFWLYKMLRK